MTGLSAPTVSRIAESLIHDDRLVAEIGVGESLGGRPPNLLEFAGSRNYIIGVDIGATAIHVVIANLNASIVAEARTPTDAKRGFEGTIEQIHRMISSLAENSAIAEDRIYGIGVAVAGIVNTRNDVVETSPTLDWYNVSITEELQRFTKLPVVVDNEARVMALGELHFGYGREYDSFICINVGYGIRAGIVVNRHLFFGTDGLAGELGHTVVDRSSDTWCRCGNHGCLQAIASGNGIAWTARNRIYAGARSLLSRQYHPNDITAETVAAAAASGDTLSIEVMNEAATSLGYGAVNLVHLFNPQALIIGGGVSKAGDMFVQVIGKTIQDRAVSRAFKNVAVHTATHGDRATVKGAVALILNRILDMTITS